ncbi:MAG: MFS transporter [Bacteroidales bacterium]
MNYIALFKHNRKILLFGMLLTLFSSFGQTFVLSLYIPWFLETFDLTRSFYSGLYAVATLGSAATLIFAGKRIDTIPLPRFTAFVIGGIVMACVLAGIAVNVVMLFFAIYMLRLFGQGLLSHTSTTTVSRFFHRARGKALSVAFLGFPIGEGLFPVMIVSTILWIGWRYTLLASAGIILLVLVPLTIYLMRGFLNKPVVEGDEPLATGSKQPAKEEPVWLQKQIIRSPYFFLYAPTVFMVGFMMTSLFFYQTFIADFKGWTVEWMAGTILAYAISSFLTSIAAGPLIDKYSAARLFPFTLFPMAIGLLVLISSSSPAITPVYWLLVGITAGLNSPLVSALYAETYGTRSLGAVRSIFTFVMVVSTALGPVVYSFFLESGFTFNHIHWGVIGVILLNALFVRLYGRKINKLPA